MSADAPTRRGLLTTAADRARARADGAALRRLLAAQQLALACDEGVLAASVLARAPAPARALVVTVRAQDAAHVSATRQALVRRGGRVTMPPSGSAEIDAHLARHLVPGRLSALRGPRDALQLLVDSERVSIGAAYVALGAIRDGALATLVAQMMASDAQHEGLLAEQVHPGDIAGAIPFGVVEGVR